MGKKLTLSHSIIPTRTLFLAAGIVVLLALWLIGVERQISQVVHRGELLQARDTLATDVAAIESEHADIFASAVEEMLAGGDFVREGSPVYATAQETTRTALNN